MGILHLTDLIAGQLDGDPGLDAPLIAIEVRDVDDLRPPRRPQRMAPVVVKFEIRAVPTWRSRQSRLRSLECDTA
jgi:hypothetical protein